MYLRDRVFTNGIYNSIMAGCLIKRFFSIEDRE